MTKVEAPTLEEAYQKASQVLACSISELQCEVVQHPTKGIFGFLKKDAIIVATCKTSLSPKEKKDNLEEEVASEILATVKEESAKKEENTKKEKNVKKEKIIQTATPEITVENDLVVDSFFEVDAASKREVLSEEESIVYDELAQLIEDQLKELLSHSCFEIDVIEVDVRDNTALIFIDGEDAALLIGKEGYRYNALSYMLFNWLHTKYELFIKLEIAEFLTSQQEMIRNYIKPVIENVEKHGRGKTRSLDGILVQIALEQLREAFPNKYVAVKTGREGNKFVVINEFNNKSHA
jgi:spoIIIJ-associated protein